MNHNGATSGYRDAIKSDGTAVTRDPITGLITLDVATYYIPWGGTNAATPAQTTLVGIHCTWGAALAATVTYQTSNAPKYMHGADAGAILVSDYEATTVGGNWIPENFSSTIVSVFGASNTVSSGTVTCGGAAIGGCMYHLPNMGARRGRLKVVVTTGGTFSANVVGKSGA